MPNLKHDRKEDRHAPDNRNITIRVRNAWLARLDAAANEKGESRMGYIRKAVEERMERVFRDEDEHN